MRNSETDFRLVECFDGRTNICTLTPSRRLKRVFHAALRTYFKELDAATLADITGPLPRPRGSAPALRGAMSISTMGAPVSRRRALPSNRSQAGANPHDHQHPGHSAPSGGFEAPLEMLSACHHRIELQCATLRRLVAHLASNGADNDARMAAASVMRYFDTSATDHHADEETDLFPALIESMAGSDAVCIRELVKLLTLDHRALESHQQRLRLVLQGIAAGASLPLAFADVGPFIASYERHIAREESELLPMAARLLGDEALDRAGKAMRERRGISAIE